MMNLDFVSEAEAREAVEVLYRAVKLSCRISLRSAQLLLSAHHGEGFVDLGVFVDFDLPNGEAARTILSYSFFCKRFTTPLTDQEVQFLKLYVGKYAG